MLTGQSAHHLMHDVDCNVSIGKASTGSAELCGRKNPETISSFEVADVAYNWS